MFLSKEKRQLDYHFLLWKYDTSKLDHTTLSKLDKGAQAAENPDEVVDKLVKTKSCCNLF